MVEYWQVLSNTLKTCDNINLAESACTNVILKPWLRWALLLELIFQICCVFTLPIPHLYFEILPSTLFKINVCMRGWRTGVCDREKLLQSCRFLAYILRWRRHRHIKSRYKMKGEGEIVITWRRDDNISGYRLNLNLSYCEHRRPHSFPQLGQLIKEVLLLPVSAPLKGFTCCNIVLKDILLPSNQ